MSSDKNDSGRLLAQPQQGKLIFFSLCFTMRTEGPQKDFSIVSSMTPSNGGNGLQHRSASSSSLQGEKERGDRGPAPRRSAADTAPKKNGDQAKRARYVYIARNASHFTAKRASSAFVTIERLSTKGHALIGRCDDLHRHATGSESNSKISEVEFLVVDFSLFFFCWLLHRADVLHLRITSRFTFLFVVLCVCE